MNIFYVYRYIRLDTNTPFYIGKGSGDRAFKVLQRNIYFKRIIAKIPYEVEIILDGLSEQQAFEKEIEFIQLYKNLEYCEANLTDGGEGKSGYTPSLEARQNMSNAHKGKIPYNKGIPMSDAQKQKLKEAKLKMLPEVKLAMVEKIKKAASSISEETRLKMSNSQKLRKRESLSEETKVKIGLANKGKTRTLTDTHRANMSKGQLNRKRK